MFGDHNIVHFTIRFQNSETCTKIDVVNIVHRLACDIDVAKRRC